MTVLAITRGLPASGKTTWARAWVGDNAASRARVNRDDLRWNLHGRYYGLTRDQEDSLTEVQTAAVRALLERRVSVVVDDTHLRLAHATRWAVLAAELGVEFEVRDFETPSGICAARDEARRAAGERAVGAAVIEGMADRYGLHDGRWLPPVVVPTATELGGPPRLYEPDTALTGCWIVDVDGTLAHMRDRGPFEWNRVGEDRADERIVALTELLMNGGDRRLDIVVVSGRDAVCRVETEDWLEAHEIEYHALFMRPAGDTRKDAVVKAELFWNEIVPRWNVLGVLDDRDQVVAMWRSLGLLCLQVAPGAF